MERNSKTISIECKDKGILLHALKSVFVKREFYNVSGFEKKKNAGEDFTL